MKRNQKWSHQNHNLKHLWMILHWINLIIQLCQGYKTPLKVSNFQIRHQLKQWKMSENEILMSKRRKHLEVKEFVQSHQCRPSKKTTNIRMMISMIIRIQLLEETVDIVVQSSRSQLKEVSILLRKRLKDYLL